MGVTRIEMRLHQVLVGDAVLRLERVDHRLVLAEGRRLEGVPGLALLHDAQDHRLHQGVDVEDRLVSQHRDQPGVEGEIVFRGDVDGIGVQKARVDPPQVRDIRGGGAVEDVLEGIARDLLHVEREDLEGRGHAVVDDRGADLGADLDDAIGLQDAHRLAHGVPGGPKGIAQLALGRKAVADGEALRADQRADAAHDLVHCGFLRSHDVGPCRGKLGHIDLPFDATRLSAFRLVYLSNKYLSIALIHRNFAIGDCS